jgi:hypothetical protein
MITSNQPVHHDEGAEAHNCGCGQALLQGQGYQTWDNAIAARLAKVQVTYNEFQDLLWDAVKRDVIRVAYLDWLDPEEPDLSYYADKALELVYPSELNVFYLWWALHLGPLAEIFASFLCSLTRRIRFMPVEFLTF